MHYLQFSFYFHNHSFRHISSFCFGNCSFRVFQQFNVYLLS
nr:MAG TPA: hypothetical protein [Caudoviricetes sp.]